MFKCDRCDKEFDSYRKLNGHKSIHKEGSRYSVTRQKVFNTNTCIHCHSPAAIRAKYCSVQCQADYEYNDRLTDWLVNKNPTGGGTIRRYLRETFGYKCSECGISDYNTKPITLELEHKDGNSENNSLENLCFLCPNCHSQTPTYRNKNRGNGRYSRRVRYAEGKSY